ncbi:competence/damage-inducible protein A [Brumimicrobium glaciale]|uniref:CinA-like protein n=1 Tax=Brumimicrobium glaciale TaxID=200475 RepID=A0A4Q4KJK4_9FLAO|nr:competence/damage-inducible protein A [Brumimicrobium glaciale]RYM33375.1 competence/damage-inducible protein A [Brumimicrobium glaciale]
MKAGIISIGDELLIGQTVNTNAAWLGQELGKFGISVYKATTIRDIKEDILQTVDEYINEADFIIVTGGLGPTNDDITKETLTEYFGTTLELNKQVLERVRFFFEQRGKEMLDSNIQQAMLPKDALILDNLHGTASGMWFEKSGKILVSLPGVPYEMEALIKEEVIPRIKSSFGIKGNYHQTLMLQGIGESFLAEIIENWEERIYKEGLHLAYLPSSGLIKLRLTSVKGNEEAGKINDYFDELRKELPQYVYGMNEETIFESVGELLKSKNATLGTIESCTGGGIASSFISKSGSSAFFQGGLITYSNALKHKLANVSLKSLEEFGAVSEEVAKEMALGGQKVLNVDYTIAVTGIAGPDGGTDEKPVGTVWIAIATPDGVFTEHYLFGEHRGRNIEKTGLYAANFLRKLILGINN